MWPLLIPLAVVVLVVVAARFCMGVAAVEERRAVDDRRMIAAVQRLERTNQP